MSLGYENQEALNLPAAFKFLSVQHYFGVVLLQGYPEVGSEHVCWTVAYQAPQSSIVKC